MPKVKGSEDELKNRIVRACIAKYIELHGYKKADIAKRIGMSARTFQNKRNYPETFTLWELRKLCNVLKIQDEERAQLL